MVGRKVRYNGSIASERGEVFVVTGTHTSYNGDKSIRLMLAMNSDMGPIMTNVRPMSVTMLEES